MQISLRLVWVFENGIWMVNDLVFVNQPDNCVEFSR